MAPNEVRVSSRPYIPPSARTLRVQTTLVEVGVVVRDARGKPIPGLKSSDFEVFDEGKPRAITSFSVENSTSPAAPTSTALQLSAKPSGELVAPPPGPKSVRPPRFVALYFDDIHTLLGDLRHAQLAAQRFIREGLEPSDRAAVFAASSSKSPGFTEDRQKLLDSIGEIKSHPRISENGMASCPRIPPYQAYLIAERHDPSSFDAASAEAGQCNCADTGNYTAECYRSQERIVRTQAEQTWQQAKIVSQDTLANIESVVRHVAQMPGNRMVLLASSGFLAGGLEHEQDRIIETALHSGVVISSLDAKGLYAEAPGRPINEILQTAELPAKTFLFEVSSLGDRLATTTEAMARFAESTGGLFFHNNNDLDFAFYLTGVMPEVTYVLGFQPDDVVPDGKYHRIKVGLVPARHYLLQARPGYFAPSKAMAQEAAPISKLDQEIFAADSIEGIPIEVIPEPGRASTGAQILWVTVHVDLRRLQFQHQQDRHVQKLSFVAALFDSKGNFVVGKQGEMNLALKDPTLARLAETGINAKMFLDVAPGSYQLRTVVQEAVEGRLSASTRPVEIR